MSVRINPCFGCPLKVGCTQRTEFSKRVSGLGLRSATFNCAKLDAALSPGTRIVVTMPVIGQDEDGSYEYNVGRHDVPATIVTSAGNKFSCIVDADAVKTMEDLGYLGENVDPNKIRFRKTMRHSRIKRFLSEPKRRLCEFGNPILLSGMCDTRDGNCPCSKVEKAA